MQHKYVSANTTEFSFTAEAIVDTWEQTREAVEATLIQLPTPLPGFTTAAEIGSIVTWALKLIHSPRVSDADAGMPHCFLFEL